ncbi:MAG TPA: FAD-binding oxidoreductase [Polyangiaceae bacterium]
MQQHFALTYDGQRIALSTSDIEALSRRLSGTVVSPGDARYETARRVWNGLVDRKPALIVGCTCADDVISAVQFARPRRLLVSVRGGGHNIRGTAICEAGMVIDLSAMNDIRVDPEARSVFSGPGVRWGQLDRATQAHGLATPGGQHSEVGIAGYTLGGGIGWLTGKYGLGVDNLKSAEVITAEGKRLIASSTENTDLFWALRGGGGNFGIVTRFELALHPIGPTVTAGMLLHPFERARDVLRFLRDASSGWSDDLHVIAVLMTVPGGGPRAVALAALYSGSAADGDDDLRALRAFGPPLQDQLQPMPYVAFQSMMDGLAPPGRCYLDRSRFMNELTDAALDAILAAYERAPSPPCTVFVHPLGGAMARVPDDATAFAHRRARYCLVSSSSWDEPAHAEAHERWTEDFLSTTAAFTTGAAYLNDLGRAEEEGDAAIRLAFGESHARLAALKHAYDPDNFFRHNQNVLPRHV